MPALRRSQVPIGVITAALAATAASLATAVWAMRVNPFFWPVVRVQAERGHRVIEAGPYRAVRHPGYAGALGVCLFSGAALGPWWVPAVAAAVMIVRRALVEERFLQDHLAGYDEYALRVRWRLAPGLW